MAKKYVSFTSLSMNEFVISTAKSFSAQRLLPAYRVSTDNVLQLSSWTFPGCVVCYKSASKQDLVNFAHESLLGVIVIVAETDIKELWLFPFLLLSAPSSKVHTIRSFSTCPLLAVRLSNETSKTFLLPTNPTQQRAEYK